MATFAIPPTLTDSVYLFRNLAEANTFFAAFQIPDATTSSGGIMEQAASVDYTDATYTPTYYNLVVVNEDLTETTHQLASKADIDGINALVAELSLKLAALVQNMKASGQLEN